ncbi:methyltransferase [Ameyamaea chiangmaiensis NBRC 103196]|uniref:Methyltransferase domain-containing protein n=1 Tax=Ameyamaea chiangmaiensis TaxID=442969 RepID=A0A850PBU1_9PROT|nr:methyltransferase domain-containing protein [Ameyamaea chiangmaiensis]MBS4073744.1 methyltransferase domain-containing protein [Ameyamaea chiangmaiensis]NVN39990.1 methyltransferase domain-containing protein [Ameyamaea chiangmaiensis]GBQ68608.1 methyltransferase [Ameyamaea chiangmaiensis NBRC 103196]
MEDNTIFDRRAVRIHRERAARTIGAVEPILDEAAERLLERLDDTTRRFTRALDIGGRGVVAPRLRARGIDVISCDLSPAMARLSGGPCVCADEEALPFGPNSFDLVIANLSLHWVNDLPGALVQIRHALCPDGLFLASMPVLPTLAPLRATLMEAEVELRGGASARVSPFPELRDCAGLLQRARFALPVADAETLMLEYQTGLALLRDLRAAGETNALVVRDRRSVPHALFPTAVMRLQSDGTFAMPLHLAMMTGWAPSADQPRPLAPGAFTVSLEDALSAGNSERKNSE